MIRVSDLARCVMGLLVCVVSSGRLSAVDLYVTGSNNATQKPIFGKIDSTTGVYTNISADTGNGFFTNYGLAWNPGISQFNTLTQNNGVLNTITSTGTVGTPIASGLSIDGRLAYSTNSSTMYLVSYNAFKTLNTSTGSSTMIGNPALDGLRSVAFHNGTLYATVGIGLGFPNYYYGSFNLNTGAFTAITGIDNFYGGMLLASDGITLYGLESTTLYTINPATGAYTFLVNVTGAPALVAMSAIPAAVPEPSTYVMGVMAAGLIGFVARKRIKKES